MTECGGLGVGKASNVVISGNWLEKKIWMGGFFFFSFLVVVPHESLKASI